MMSPERWKTVKRLFHEVLEQPLDRRTDHLDALCGTDSQLRSEVERLLRQHEQGEEFLEDPVLSVIDPSWVSALAEREGILRQGTHIDCYTVQNVIGEGGMGVVYRAVHDVTKQPVAMKVLRVGFANHEAIKRFQREIRLLARLDHPGIAKILSSGTTEDELGRRPFYAMELIEGQTVRRYAEQNNLSTNDRLILIARIAEAVHHAHQQNIVHRDLKPANIMVDEDGQPKVLDFGVARSIDSDINMTTLRTDVGKLIGTIAYMSPEQVAGSPDALDTRSDIYALGVVAYELLTGRLPYDLANKPIPEAIRIIGNDDPTPLSSINHLFRGEVETILSKALEKDRTRRYQTANDFASDIWLHLSHKPILARPTSTIYQFRRFARRNKALVASIVLAFAALVAGIVGTTTQTMKAREQLRTVNKVNRFLQDLLESPFYDERGPSITVLDLYEQIPSELEARFPDKPEVKAPIYLGIGNTYQQVGLVDKAEVHVRTSYKYFLEAYGEEHDRTVRAMNWLALLLERQGKLTEAEQLGRLTMDIHARMSGPDHSFPISTIINLANTLRQQEKLEESERLLRGVIAQFELTPKEYRTNLYYAQSVLARVLIKTDRLDEAERFAGMACDGFLRMFGEKDWRIMYALQTKARAWWALGRMDEAESLMGDVLRRRREALGTEHPAVVSALYELAKMQVARGAFSEGWNSCTIAITIGDKMMRSGHWRLARLRSLRGKCELQLNMLDEAEADLNAAHQQLALVLGDHHSTTSATLVQLTLLRQTLRNVSKHAAETATLAGVETD